MATNMPQALDEALLRPGRIDRMYKVGYPSKDGRKRTYEGYFAKVSHELTDEQLEKLSVITPYATGASIKDLVNEALITAIRDGREIINWADVITAKHLKTLGPGEDVEYVNRERHSIAVHEACHAIAAYRLRRHMEIDIATIEKGGTYLGMVSSIPPDDQFTRWRSEYEVDIKVALASLAGERIFFAGDNSSGVSGDLESATAVATMMEGFWGMGETISSYAVARRVIGGGGGGPRPGGDDGPDATEAGFNQTLGKRIEENLQRLFEEAEQLLSHNRREVLALAHALETYKTLSGEDVAAVVEGSVGPLVDGRIYGTDEFLEEAERYHTLAVTAHDEHSSVPVDMPDWRPKVPELVAARPTNGDQPQATASPSGPTATNGPAASNGPAAAPEPRTAPTPPPPPSASPPPATGNGGVIYPAGPPIDEEGQADPPR
jgi:cell division protease FtsH